MLNGERGSMRRTTMFSTTLLKIYIEVLAKTAKSVHVWKAKETCQKAPENAVSTMKNDRFT
jgi:hypothetical protein